VVGGVRIIIPYHPGAKTKSGSNWGGDGGGQGVVKKGAHNMINSLSKDPSLAARKSPGQSPQSSEKKKGSGKIQEEQRIERGAHERGKPYKLF